MNMLDAMTNIFEGLFLKKYSHHVSVCDREKELLESHKILREEINTMLATLDGEEKWFLRVVHPDKENLTNDRDNGISE